MCITWSVTCAVSCACARGIDNIANEAMITPIHSAAAEFQEHQTECALPYQKLYLAQLQSSSVICNPAIPGQPTATSLAVTALDTTSLPCRHAFDLLRCSPSMVPGVLPSGLGTLSMDIEMSDKSKRGSQQSTQWPTKKQNSRCLKGRLVTAPCFVQHKLVSSVELCKFHSRTTKLFANNSPTLWVSVASIDTSWQKAKFVTQKTQKEPAVTAQ